MNAVQHSPCAKSAAMGGAQRSLRHHKRLQRSEVDGPARMAARQVYINNLTINFQYSIMRGERTIDGQSEEGEHIYMYMFNNQYSIIPQR